VGPNGELMQGSFIKDIITNTKSMTNSLFLNKRKCHHPWHYPSESLDVFSVYLLNCWRAGAGVEALPPPCPPSHPAPNPSRPGAQARARAHGGGNPYTPTPTCWQFKSCSSSNSNDSGEAAVGVITFPPS
jgi:hypothetical protein